MSPISGQDLDVAQLPSTAQRRQTNVLVVTSVALSFISFWRAAAIVLCDLASTAYYIGGISEQAIGKAAPWFILGVMLFSYAVRAVYVESCTMFTRGGVYKVVKGAVGGGVAKLSVSALMFDYVLTGPISAVAAGVYLVGLFGDMLALLTERSRHPLIFNATTHPDAVRFLTVIIAILITLYFWRANIIGMHESSDKALRIMQLTTVMGVVIIGWSALTIWLNHIPITAPPIHPVFTQSSMDPTKESSAGWLEDTNSRNSVKVPESLSGIVFVTIPSAAIKSSYPFGIGKGSGFGWGRSKISAKKATRIIPATNKNILPRFTTLMPAVDLP